MSTDYSQSMFPMGLITAAPLSVMNDLGSLTCAQTLAPPYESSPGSLCGFENGPYYGVCGHVDVDEASGYLTCGNQTSCSRASTYAASTMPVNRTMVISLAPTIFNSRIKRFGGVQASGGAQVLQ